MRAVESEHREADALAASRSATESVPTEMNSLEKELTELRSQISDLGFELDTHKAGTAASMGGGVFLVLLAVIVGCDMFAGKGGIWSPLGITQDALLFITWGLGIAGVALLAQGYLRQSRRDRKPEARLAELQKQYTLLLDRKDAASKDQT
jgi:hypothetical protein